LLALAVATWKQTGVAAARRWVHSWLGSATRSELAASLPAFFEELGFSGVEEVLVLGSSLPPSDQQAFAAVLAESALLSGQADQALACLPSLTAVESVELQADVYVLRSMALRATRRHAEAEALLDRVLADAELQSHPVIRVEKARRLVEAGEESWAQAVQEIRAALEESPTLLAAYVLLQGIHQRRPDLCSREQLLGSLQQAAAKLGEQAFVASPLGELYRSLLAGPESSARAD
jgi:hypothetical protein